MKADWFGRPIVGAVVLALLFCGAGQTRAATIDFEDLVVTLAVMPGTQQVLPPATGVVTGGFYYTPDPLNGMSFNDLHISNAKPDSSFNGTTVGITHNDGILTKDKGGTFSLQHFDFAGFPLNKEVPFKVTGDRADLSTITQTFGPGALDGLVDGVGGVVDFQTFSLVGDWTNLKRVRWTHTGYGTITGLFALDNIVVDQYAAVPEPSTITLLELGILCLLGQGWRSRKQLKALGDMA